MSQCKGCDRTILWGRTPEGKQIPLDPTAPVYSLIESNGQTVVVRTELAMVSHFATCPNANQFSASRKDSSNHSSINSNTHSTADGIAAGSAIAQPLVKVGHA